VRLRLATSGRKSHSATRGFSDRSTGAEKLGNLGAELHAKFIALWFVNVSGLTTQQKKGCATAQMPVWEAR
jgi:hypothetical protein